MVHVQAWTAAACVLVAAGVLLWKVKGAGGGGGPAAGQEVQKEEEAEEEEEEDQPSPRGLPVEEPAEPVWDPLQFSADASKRRRMLEIKYGHLSLLANVGLVGASRCSSTQSTDIDSNCSTESPPPEHLLPTESGESCPSSDREEAERAPRPQERRAPAAAPPEQCGGSGVEESGHSSGSRCLGTPPAQSSSSDATADSDSEKDSENVMMKRPVLELGAPEEGTDQHPSAIDPDKIGEVDKAAPGAEGGPRALSGGHEDSAGQLLEPDEEPPPPPARSPQPPAAAPAAVLPGEHSGRAADAAPAGAAVPPAGAGEALSFAFPRGSLWSEFAEDDLSTGAAREKRTPEQQEDATAAPQPQLPKLKLADGLLLSKEEPVPCRRWGGQRSQSAARSRSQEPEPPPQPAAETPQPKPGLPQLPALSDLLPADLEKCPGWRLRAAADLQRGLPQQQAGASSPPADALPKKARKNPKDQDLSMQKIMQCLEGVEQDRILIVRKMKKLGFDSAGHLRAHFAAYGVVETVYVSHSHLQGRMRPASLGFVVLDSKESAKAALAAGYVQVIRGNAVYIDAFEQLERKERLQA